jgi:endonuclease/exonuclease/phosphatase family metal-dependent hydrolase
MPARGLQPGVPLLRNACLSALIGLSAGTSLCAQTAPTANTTRIRIVSGNLTSGRFQSYDPGHGSRIFQGLKPDIALIQEMNAGDKSDAAARAWARAVFGAQFSIFREEGEIPNGIASRWPIIASGEWDDPAVVNRDFVWSRIDIPGARDLWVISVHFLTKSQSKRGEEAGVLVKLIREHIPGKDYLALGGDLNTGNRQEPCLSDLGAQFVVSAPFPADEAGQEGTNAKRANPYDWILVDQDLDKFKAPVIIGARTFPGGLIFDSRVFTLLEDVAPVQREDSAAEQMQHMAVVRDFVIPVDDLAKDVPAR